MRLEASIKISEKINLPADLSSPALIKAWVLFVHGSGSSRKSPRNQKVSQQLNELGFGTVLFDLLTEREDMHVKNRFNISLLAERLLAVTKWFMRSDFHQGRPVAYFGASTGAAAAIKVLGQLDSTLPVYTIVSRGGRPDLAGTPALNELRVPVLLLVGTRDREVIELNRLAMRKLHHSKISLIQGAGHLFEETGALDEVVRQTSDWLMSHHPGKSKEQSQAS
jgi:putative phosphoribosyl transferase